MLKLNDKYYDALKWLALIFLPALAVLVAGIGEVYAWPVAGQVVATINLLAVFLGALLQKSSFDYWKEDERDESGR